MKRVLAIRRASQLLDTMHPWFAAGQTSAVPATGSRFGTAANPPQSPRDRIHIQQSILERATLFSIVRTTPTTQFCPDAPSHDLVSLQLPGVTDIDHVFQLTAVSLRPLATSRVAGGVEAQLSLSSNTALLLVTRDDAIVREMADALNQSTRATADLTAQQIEIELDDEQAAHTSDHHYYVDTEINPLGLAQNEFLRALGQQDYVESQRLGNELLQQLAQRRFEGWHSLVRQIGSPGGCPLAAHASSRPLLSQMRRRIDLVAPSINLLPSGGCDDMTAMNSAGWQVTVADDYQAGATATVATEQPYAGAGCLQLTVRSPHDKQDLVEQPLIWARSPQTTIGANQVFRIDGWVRCERDELAPGLLVFDSLSGPVCGLHMTPGTRWTPFSLYRATAVDSPVTVTFALTAPGRVSVDNISITPLISTSSLKK